MSKRIVTVITCWTASCENHEEYFVGVHDTFDSACSFVNECINESGEKPTFDKVDRAHGLQSTQIYEGERSNNTTVYYMREQYLEERK